MTIRYASKWEMLESWLRENITGGAIIFHEPAGTAERGNALFHLLRNENVDLDSLSWCDILVVPYGRDDLGEIVNLLDEDSW